MHSFPALAVAAALALAGLFAGALAGGQYYVPRAYYTIDAEGHPSAPVPMRRLRRSLGASPLPSAGASASANSEAHAWGRGGADADANASARAGAGGWGLPLGAGYGAGYPGSFRH